MTGPKEKIERALGERLGLKARRCASPKCAMVRKPYRPGAHGHSRRRGTLSEFGRQLREKRKVKVSYGIDERNLRQIVGRAKPLSGATIMELLERRLDNVVFRFGFAPSRIVARQLIAHGHITLNGHKAKSPGIQVNVGDVVGIRSESREKGPFKDLGEAWKLLDIPTWLILEKDTQEGKIAALPHDIESQFEMNLLVESFSK